MISLSNYCRIRDALRRRKLGLSRYQYVIYFHFGFRSDYVI